MYELWNRFRRLPVWAQIILWVVGWPLLIGLFIFRSGMANAKIIGVAVATISSALFYPPIAMDRHDAKPIAAPTTAPAPTVDEYALMPTFEPTPEPEPEPSIATKRARVVSVTDGDTIVVAMHDRSQEKVRLIGIDAPEYTSTRERLGAEATAAARRALDDETVYLEIGVDARDRYNRLLAYVWLKQPPVSPSSPFMRKYLFNARMLATGLATLLTIEPNSQYEYEFEAFEGEAKEADLGLWKPLPKPKPKVVAKPKAPTRNCHPSYSPQCLDPNAYDYDCLGGSGDGPKYVDGPVYVNGYDEFDLDRDGNGVGCES